jgi:hypothetical protein
MSPVDVLTWVLALVAVVNAVKMDEPLTKANILRRVIFGNAIFAKSPIDIRQKYSDIQKVEKLIGDRRSGGLGFVANRDYVRVTDGASAACDGLDISVLQPLGRDGNTVVQ